MSMQFRSVEGRSIWLLVIIGEEYCCIPSPTITACKTASSPSSCAQYILFASPLQFRSEPACFDKVLNRPSCVCCTTHGSAQRRSKMGCLPGSGHQASKFHVCMTTRSVSTGLCKSHFTISPSSTASSLVSVGHDPDQAAANSTAVSLAFFSVSRHL